CRTGKDARRPCVCVCVCVCVCGDRKDNSGRGCVCGCACVCQQKRRRLARTCACCVSKEGQRMCVRCGATEKTMCVEENSCHVGVELNVCMCVWGWGDRKDNVCRRKQLPWEPNVCMCVWGFVWASRHKHLRE